MPLDTPPPLVEFAQDDAVTEHRPVVIGHGRPQVRKPNSDIIKACLQPLETGAVTAHRLRNFGKQLVDRSKVDPVAASCQASSPALAARNNIPRSDGELSRCGPFARKPRHEAVVIDNHAFVEAFADWFGFVAAADLEVQPAAVDLDELNLGGDVHADWRCGAMGHLDPCAD